VAAQNQGINTNFFMNKILKEEIESKCQLYKQHEEIIDHLTSGCPFLAKSDYLMTHTKVCVHLHYSICKALGIKTTEKWYTHMPKPVYEEGISECCGIKQYTQTEKLQQIVQIQ
jgi:hypothetical protein